MFLSTLSESWERILRIWEIIILMMKNVENWVDETTEWNKEIKHRLNDDDDDDDTSGFLQVCVQIVSINLLQAFHKPSPSY